MKKPIIRVGAYSIVTGNLIASFVCDDMLQAQGICHALQRNGYETRLRAGASLPDKIEIGASTR